MISLLRKTFRPEKTVSGLHYVMGTFLTIQVLGSEPALLQRTRDDLFQEVEKLEKRLSIFHSDSEISRINRAAGHSAVRVSPDTWAAIRQALTFSQLTHRAFDPTIGPLTRLWGFDGFEGRLPTEENLNQARHQVDYRQVVLDSENSSVFLSVPGMSLDMGALGKGFALDQALKRVQGRDGVDRIHFNFGGQLLFWSRTGSFPPETVAIENPVGGFLSSFEVRSNCSVSTSSNAQRRLRVRTPAGDFKEYGHLLDPQTGQPAESLSSVTTIAPTATEAEAFSTALFVMGSVKGRAFLKTHRTLRAFFF